MKNKLTDLNDHLFAQLERLSEEDITAENLEKEMKRTVSIINIGRVIVENAKVVVEAHKLFGNGTLDSVPGIVEQKQVEQK